jgi:hypothetical protein
MSFLELDLMVEQGEWWEVLEVLWTAINFFQKFVFGFCLYLGFIVLLFKSQYLDFGEFQKTTIVHWVYKVNHR